MKRNKHWAEDLLRGKEDSRPSDFRVKVYSTGALYQPGHVEPEPVDNANGKEEEFYVNQI